MSDKQYNVVNDTAYDSRTPTDLVALLERLRQNKTRCVFVYGNVETGVPWGESTLDRGTIGRSMGSYKIPLLIRTSRSMGGEGILDHCILQVRESKGGKVLYQRTRNAMSIAEESHVGRDHTDCFACQVERAENEDDTGPYLGAHERGEE